MSIQRFEGATAPDGNGRYVLYVDHVAAMDEQRDIRHDEKQVSYMEGQEAERARIKAAVQSLRKNYYGEELDLAKVKGYLLAIIDGEQA